MLALYDVSRREKKLEALPKMKIRSDPNSELDRKTQDCKRLPNQIKRFRIQDR